MNLAKVEDSYISQPTQNTKISLWKLIFTYLMNEQEGNTPTTPLWNPIFK